MRKTLLLMMGIASWAAAQISLPDSMTIAGNSITWVKKLTRYCEGPAWEPTTGTVYFSGGAGPIWKIRPGVDTGSVFVSTPSSNGLAFDPQGRLVACQTGRLTRYRNDGTVDSVLVQSGGGITIGNANDLSFGANGAIYFTDLGTRVLYLSPTRQLTVVCTSTTAFPIGNANGIEWIEEKNFVQLNMSGTVNQVRRYTVQTGGTLANPTLSMPSPGADGGTFDSHGNFYVADNVNGRVRVFNANGDSVGEILLRLATGSFDFSSGNRGNVSNCVFGGADLKTLYITGDGGLYSIPLKIAGRPPATTTLTPPTVAFTPSTVADTIGKAVTHTPTTTGTITSCSSTPTLPSPLVLSSACVIAGTPTAASAAQAYTITASNSTGTGNTTLTLSVLIAKPTVSFTPSTVVDTIGRATTHTPTITGTVTSCASVPTLPSPLTLSSACVIAGTPTTASASQAYTVTAANSTGSGSTVLNLRVVGPVGIIPSPMFIRISGASSFQFSVAKGEGVRVIIYDVKQRQVWSSSQSKDEMVEWHGTGNDGRLLPQGLYFAVSDLHGKILTKQ